MNKWSLLHGPMWAKTILTLLMGSVPASYLTLIDSAPTQTGASWEPWLIVAITTLTPAVRSLWAHRAMKGNPLGWVLERVGLGSLLALLLAVMSGCVTTKTHVSTTDADGASVEYGWVAFSLAGKQDSSGGDITTTISKDGAYKLSAGAQATGQDSQVIATVVSQVLAELAKMGVFVR